MALDSNLAARYVFDILAGDTTLNALLGASGNIFRREALRDAKEPLIVVDVQSVQERVGAIRSGPNTHSGTPLTVRTSIWDLNTYANIEQIAARMDLLLDGTGFVDTGDGTVYECLRSTDLPRDQVVGDVVYKGWDIFWTMLVKAN